MYLPCNNKSLASSGIALREGPGRPPRSAPPYPSAQACQGTHSAPAHAPAFDDKDPTTATLAASGERPRAAEHGYSQPQPTGDKNCDNTLKILRRPRLASSTP